MPIKLSSVLPKGDGNGLDAITSQLIREERVHVAIVILDCPEYTVKKDEGDTIPKARIRRIEVIQGDGDRKQAEVLMRRALELRSGVTTLPYDLEDELRGVFGDRDEDAFRETPGSRDNSDPGEPGEPGTGTGR